MKRAFRALRLVLAMLLLQAFGMAIATQPAIAAAITIAPATLPYGTVGMQYFVTSLVASGGTPGYTFAVTAGSLPGGLLLSNGVLGGRPMAAGVFHFTVTATDAVGLTGERAYALTILPQRLPLTVAKAGSGAGTVTSSPAGIDCGATCWGAFDLGAAVALSAQPAPGSGFAGWSGVCTGTGVCNVTVNAAKVVTATFEVAANVPRLGNLSTRGQVLAGNDVMIGGFVIGGSGNKTVVVRARGPSLVPYGITDPLGDPRVELVRSSDSATLAANDDWGSGADAPAIAASGFAPVDAREAAILASLPPGAYTAIVSGAAGGSGVGIVEVFEVDAPLTPLVNISARGRVGDEAMIGGFVIQGVGPQTVVVRARGPSLAPFGIADPLANPTLTLVRSSDQSILATNDDWGDGAGAAAITDAGLAPGDPLESAILVTLPPGAYTAIVRGVAGGAGVAIVEVFRR